MNAIELNAKTVKALNVIARDLGMKRYSALRKAELVAAIVDFTYQAEREAEIAAIEVESTPNVKILSTEVEADHAEIVKIMAEVAPVTFSAAPVKAPQIDAKPRITVAPKVATNIYAEVDTDELVAAYQGYRATFRKARGITQVKIGNKLRTMSVELKSRKVAMREV